MASLNDIVNYIASKPEHEKGKLFEILCKYFLMHDKNYSQIFSDIYLWNEWPENNSKPDTGIDIAAKIKGSENYCAIQCKFHGKDSYISKPEIDSFLSASSKNIFSERILISLYGNYGKNAKDTLENQNPPCRTLTLDDLENSTIDWESFSFADINTVKYKHKTLRKDQINAVEAVINSFRTHERGKLIMACGTGKTLTSLRIAETYANKDSLVLFLVPSISLLNQSLKSWNEDRNINIIPFAVCSDKTVGKKIYPDEDLNISDLIYPPTTDSKNLVEQWQKISDSEKSNSMCVIFSTYQSLNVIQDAQKNGLPKFNLIICDEAHRTTGAKLEGKDESYFTRVHYNEFINADKRLYMTATPRIFADNLKKNENYILCSMDDEKIYGPEFYRLSFTQAVNANLLCDYKVMIFMIDAEQPKPGQFYDVTEHAKITGCYKALAKEVNPEDFEFISKDTKPMQKAVAFTSKINYSKDFVQNFSDFMKESQHDLHCEVQHIDGSTPSFERNKLLHWLESNENENNCRILSNARCLCEGVDVPALDAVIFLNPRKSEIDIVQSVGRVMRKSPGKNFGYVILPVVVVPGQSPEEALDKNESYSVVWKVLQALRSHDDNFNAVVNSLDLNKRSDKILIVRKTGLNGEKDLPPEILKRWQEAIGVAIVKKCGDREYFDKWVKNIADIAQQHSITLRKFRENNAAFNAKFNDFLSGLHENINPTITEDQAIDMLSQHIISRRVFDALFSDFSKFNPVSRAIQKVLGTINENELYPLDSLSDFYSKVDEAVKEANTGQAKQRLIKNIYQNFFRIAFKNTAEKLGIVYTPEEVVDFILHSADWAVKNILGIKNGLSAKDVHILDPFSGTGTFTARLLQSGIISPEMSAHKYLSEIHANEILLLAYYISAVNIESAFHEEGREIYNSFPGIVLTDTFKLNKPGDSTKTFNNKIFFENGERAHKQECEKITVIIGNPPYSAGQKSANDNNQNEIYPELRDAIKATYAKRSTATNKNSLYDSYICAIKWASERIKNNEKGIICFITNGSFIDSNSADGMRKCLAEDFSAIYIYNLRGNQNAGDWRKEGGKIFGSGSKLPAAITLFVRDSSQGGECEIYYYEVGDYMKADEKLKELQERVSFGAMIESGMMRRIFPNEFGDWISGRNEIFEAFLNLGNKKEKERSAIFGGRYSRGVATGRDSWCYNFSRDDLARNMASMIEMYNNELNRWQNHKGKEKVEDFVNNDGKKISWSHTLYNHAEDNKVIKFRDDAIRVSLYRPFVKEYMYFDRYANEAVYKIPSMFPEQDTKNLVIYITGIGATKTFSVLMTNCIPNLHLLDTGQCFPLYWYERIDGGLFGSGLVRYDGISDEALEKFRLHYCGSAITKEDIFYYIYGVLSSREYCERFGSDTKKILARVPFANDFRAFCEAGRKLGALHVNYESVDEWPLTLNFRDGCEKNLRVKRMRVIDVKGERCIRYNDCLTVSGIPSSAWDFCVNGRSALEWIADRYEDSVDGVSGLRNDCNEWDAEGYVLRLIGRVVRVSVESAGIIANLPELGV